MKLIPSEFSTNHRGIIGVESAIVMIAFVIVAATLAFVVLNMGFSTTQKAKTTITAGLTEASSGLEVPGKVIGFACTDSAGKSPDCGLAPRLNATTIPIKITSGGGSVNLDPALTSIKYLSNSVQHDDIYKGTLNTTTYRSLSEAMTAAQGVPSPNYIHPADAHPITGNTTVSKTIGIMYWDVSIGTQNSVLDQGEHAVLAIIYADADRPQSLDTIRVEIVVAEGATMTLERNVPTLTNLITDMG